MMRTDENAETDCCLDIIKITVEFNVDKQRARQIGAQEKVEPQMHIRRWQESKSVLNSE